VSCLILCRRMYVLAACYGRLVGDRTGLLAETSSDFGQTALTAFQAVKNVQKPLRSAS
jgi:hypothetical protein